MATVLESGLSYISQNANKRIDLMNMLISINSKYLNNYDNEFAANPKYIGDNVMNDIMMLINGYNGADYKTDKNTDLFYKIKDLNESKIFKTSNQSYTDFINKGGICPYIKVNNTYTLTSINNFVDDSINNISTFNDTFLGVFLGNGKMIRGLEIQKLYIGLYAIYDILSSLNISSLLAGKNVKIELPNTTDGKMESFNIKYINKILVFDDKDSIKSINMNIKLIDAINSVININEILSDPNFNLFVFRQLVRLYIILFNLNIAANIFRTVSNANIIRTESFRNNLLNFKYLIVSNILILSTLTGEFSNLLSDENNKINNDTNTIQINNQISEMNSTSKVFNNLKDSIKTGEDYYGKIQKSQVSKYEYVSLVFLLIIILLSIILEFSVDNRGSFILSIIIVIISSISYIIINYLYGRSLLETFVVSNVRRDQIEIICQSGIDISNIDKNIEYYKTLNNVTINEYLNTILGFLNIKEQENTNANMAILLSNQQMYYEDTLKKMDMENNKLDSSSAIVLSSRNASTYRMNLYSNLTLIIAITVILRSGLSSFNTGLPFYIGILGIILAIISVILFMIEISQRVRTDPKRLYWYADRNALKSNIT